jgi:hypothetical protein
MRKKYLWAVDFLNEDDVNILLQTVSDFMDC